MKIKTFFTTFVLVSFTFTSCHFNSKDSIGADVVTDTLSAAVTENAMPDVTIERTDGTKLQLSSLFGKTLFLDFWATWCPPCCAEIPHLEKLAEQFANNQDIRIISISVDQDRDAWIKKVAEDKPTWEQYRISADDADAFFSAIELETIPRFIIVDSDGSIINADAPRPSDDICATTIQQAVDQ